MTRQEQASLGQAGQGHSMEGSSSLGTALAQWDDVGDGDGDGDEKKSQESTVVGSSYSSQAEPVSEDTGRI